MQGRGGDKGEWFPEIKKGEGFGKSLSARARGRHGKQLKNI